MLLRLIVVLASLACLLARSEEYQIAAASGDLFALEVAKTGFLSGKKHRFVFDKYRGAVTFDRQAPENSKAAPGMIGTKNEMAVEFRFTLHK